MLVPVELEHRVPVKEPSLWDLFIGAIGGYVILGGRDLKLVHTCSYMFIHVHTNVHTISSSDHSLSYLSHSSSDSFTSDMY